MAITSEKRIRNFCIIAHIDHGKSTLADRLLEKTGVMALRDMTDQVLDSMELERERGITIKSKAVRLPYKGEDGQMYELNLIDTPGHVDFTYEVSRALAACEGAILVVDATQGIEAQTLANVYLALDHDLEILPVINKIDLPSAQPEVVKKEIEDEIGLDTENCPLISAKMGIGIEDVLKDIVARVPAPEGDPDAPLQALIFDSYYDNYRGAISSVRVKQGRVKVGDRIRMMAGKCEFDVTEVGAFTPTGYLPTDELSAGDVGYIAASIKDIADIHVGDTITLAQNPAEKPLPGYKPVQPMVFCGIYPADGAEYEEVYIEEELENGEPADDELTDDEDYTEISYETLVMTDRDSHCAIIPDELSRPEDLLRAVVRVLDSKKARGLKVLRVADKTIIADYFVMCTGTSNTQLRALSGELEERLAEVGVHPGHIEGYNEASWIIMDYASVIVHIFDRETRNFYNLEKLWGDAEEIDIDSLLVD